ncbi:MAG: VTT domain-containing protein [Solobacterium sp.]|nr:VTT domain-containing protein [Solobacterium sp.]MBQ1321856.1 VTT domain-containing protein [Solobacterium sp.]MBQ1356456.1 VTT domain-containing protein [Solobacterium sp.]
MKTGKRLEQTGAVIAISAVVAGTLLLILKVYGPHFADIFRLLSHGNQEEISEFLNRSGQWEGLLIVFMLSILQVISIIIPGMAIQVSAGLIYSWWKAFLVTYLGFVSGNMLVFFAARKLGDRVYDLLPDKSRQTWLGTKINSANSGFVIALGYLVPGVPNGIVPYIASTTDLTVSHFGFCIGAASWIQILSNCLAGHFLARGEYFYTVMSFAVQIFIIIFVSFNKEQVLRITTKIRTFLWQLQRRSLQKRLDAAQKELNELRSSRH